MSTWFLSSILIFKVWNIYYTSQIISKGPSTFSSHCPNYMDLARLFGDILCYYIFLEAEFSSRKGSVKMQMWILLLMDGLIVGTRLIILYWCVKDNIIESRLVDNSSSKLDVVYQDFRLRLVLEKY